MAGNIATSAAFANDLLLEWFNGVALALPGSLFLALHTADPLADGGQDTGEVAYAGYARQAVARTEVGFPVVGNQVTLAVGVEFPKAPAGTAPQTATFVTLGTAAAGVGKVLLRLQMSPVIQIAEGVVPRIDATTQITLPTS